MKQINKSKVFKQGKKAIALKDTITDWNIIHTYIIVRCGSVKNGHNQYFPDTKEGMKRAMLYFDYLEEGNPLEQPRKFEEYLKHHNP